MIAWFKCHSESVVAFGPRIAADAFAHTLRFVWVECLGAHAA